jgi:hypothetical protein
MDAEAERRGKHGDETTDDQPPTNSRDDATKYGAARTRDKIDHGSGMEGAQQEEEQRRVARSEA